MLLIAAAVALTAYVWPGWAGAKLKQASVEAGVQRILTDENPDIGYSMRDVSDVVCPAGQPAKVGHAFPCTVKVGDETQKVTVTVIDDSGTYSVSKPEA